jgi:Gpi18-like mannosyltransferase
MTNGIGRGCFLPVSTGMHYVDTGFKPVALGGRKMTAEVKTKTPKKAGTSTKPAKKTETPVSGRTIYWVIIGVLVARFLLTLLPSHKVDMGGYDYWSHFLADPFRGFNHFYNSDINDKSGLWVVYGPAYMYLLLIAGKLAAWFQLPDLTHEFLIKSWAVLFEFAGAYLIYLIGKSLGKSKTGFWAAIAYVMNPAIFINSSIWGQFDSVLATILLAVVYCFCIKKPVYAAILYFVSVMTKPQSIFLLPLVAYVFFFQDIQWKKVFAGGPSGKEELKAYFNKDYWLKVLYGTLGILAAWVALLLPFFSTMPQAHGKPLQVIFDFFMWMPRHYLRYVNDYPYASANGFNLWFLLGGQTVEDKNPFWGLTYIAWERVFLVALCFYSLWYLIKLKRNQFSLYYLAYVLGFGFFMVYGRMHERYLVPALIFMFAMVLWDAKLWVPTVILSGCVLANQWYLYEQAKLDNYWMPNQDPLGLAVSWVSFIILLYSFYYLYKFAKKQKEKLKLKKA